MLQIAAAAAGSGVSSNETNAAPVRQKSSNKVHQPAHHVPNRRTGGCLHQPAVTRHHAEGVARRRPVRCVGNATELEQENPPHKRIERKDDDAG